MAHSYHTDSVEETIALGEKFSTKLSAGNIVALFGDLGTGKTHFIKGVCRGLGVHEHVASPTFTIVNEYDAGGVKICHVDCYRLQSEKELRNIGFEDYLFGSYICLIEWADRIEKLLPPVRIDVRFQLGSKENMRDIIIEHHQEIPA